MPTKEKTEIEVFAFGDEEEDNFYCLVDLEKSPNGIDLERLRLTDPRKFDAALDEMGCILMLAGNELEELINRGEIDDSDLHSELYDLAKKEGFI